MHKHPVLRGPGDEQVPMRKPHGGIGSKRHKLPGGSHSSNGLLIKPSPQIGPWDGGGGGLPDGGGGGLPDGGGGGGLGGGGGKPPEKSLHLGVDIKVNHSYLPQVC